MALFGRNEEGPMAKQSNSAVSNQINMIGEGTVFEGTLTSEGDVRISGRVNGKLEIKGKVIVAQEGTVDGEIKAASLDVAGRVEGQIEVEERVVLKSSAVIDGDIRTSRLVVEEGAVFNGKCQMGNRAVRSEAIVNTDEEEVRTDVSVRRASA